MSTRTDKMRKLLKEEISDILRREIKDPRLGFFTVIDAEITSDMRHAKVFVSTLGDEEDARYTLGVLRRRRAHLQRWIAERGLLRHTPRLAFYADRTAARAQRIETLLAKVAQEPPLPDPPLAPDEDNAPEG